MKKIALIFLLLTFFSIGKSYCQPAGSVVAWAGPKEKVPTGWLPCDGRAVKKTDYAALFNIIGTSWGGDAADNFYLPDLRGLFLRGVDEGKQLDLEASKRDPSRADLINKGNTGASVGSKQTDMLVKHHHSSPVSWYHPSDKVEGGETWRKEDTGTSTTSDEGGVETRPKNAYVYYIIKY